MANTTQDSLSRITRLRWWEKHASNRSELRNHYLTLEKLNIQAIRINKDSPNQGHEYNLTDALVNNLENH